MSKYQARPRDKLGARRGTIASRVNGAISGRWQSVEQITIKAGLPLPSVRRRLYNGTEKGIYEHQHIIRFRVAPKRKRRKKK